MEVSAAGRSKIRQREGEKRTAYRDSVGVWTIGVGHTGRMSPPLVHPGMKITAGQSDAFLQKDLAPVEDALNRFVTEPLTQNQFDAMASLGFNIGVHGLIGSTVVHMVNQKRYEAAADAFLMWERPQALRARRIDERKQFLTPDPKGVANVQPDPSTVAGNSPPVIDDGGGSSGSQGGGLG